MAETLSWSLVVRDRASGTLRKVEWQLKRTRDAAQNADGAGSKKSSGDGLFSDDFRKRAATAAKGLAVFASRAAMVAGAMASMTAAAIHAAPAVIHFGAAVASTSATLGTSMLPVLAGAGALLKGTFALGLGKAARELPQFTSAVKPLTQAFSGFRAELTATFMRGIRPLAQEFVRVNFPSLHRNMLRIATATNGVATATGKWVNSAAGQKVIAHLGDRTAGMMERLQPKVSKLVVAIGRLTGRSIDPTFDNLEPLLGRLIDKATAFVNSLSTKKIRKSYEDLKALLKPITDRLRMLRDVGRWMKNHADGVKQFSNAMGALALVAGIATGGWMVALGGGLTLLANNWDTVKKKTKQAADGLKKWLDRNPEVTKTIGTLKEEFQKFGAAVKKQVDKIVPKAKEFGRAMQRAFNAWAPEIRFGIRVLGFLWRVGVRVFGGFAQSALAMGTMVMNAAARVRRGISKVVAFLRNAFKNPKALLSKVGQRIVEGLASGIRGAGHLVVDAAKALAGILPDWVKRVLDIRSPSRVFRRIGEHTIDGWADGMRIRGRRLRGIVRSLAHGMHTDVEKAAAKLAGSLGSRIASALAKVRELKQARKEYISSAASQIRDTGSLANLELPSSGSANAGSLLEQLQQRASAVRAQRRMMARLRKMGLGRGALEQLMGMDPADAARMGRGIVAGGRGAVKQINALQRDIARNAKGTATAMGHQMKDAGIKAAEGMVAGLKRGRKALIALAHSMGRAVVKAVRKALRMHSPSREFDDIGVLSTAGWAGGLRSGHGAVVAQAERTARATAAAARGAAVASRAGAGGAVAGAAAGGGLTVIVNVTQPLGTPDQIWRAVAQAAAKATAGGPKLPLRILAGAR